MNFQNWKVVDPFEIEGLLNFMATMLHIKLARTQELREELCSVYYVVKFCRVLFGVCGSGSMWLSFVPC